MVTLNTQVVILFMGAPRGFIGTILLMDNGRWVDYL